MGTSATENHNEETERKERLKKKAARQKELDNSEAWEPKSGDDLFGEIYGWQKREHPKWGVWYKVFLKDEEGNIFGLPTFHGVLQNELSRTGAKVGDLVVIIYNGKVDPEDEEENSYHNYTVVTEGEEEEQDTMPFESPSVE